MKIKSVIMVLTLFLVSLTIEATSPCVLSEYEQRDLQLFTTYQHKPGLMASIDRTQTAMGKAFFKERLANPLVAINQLQERQDIIKIIGTDAQLYEFLSQQLKAFAQHEHSLTTIAAPSVMSKTIINNFYFKNRYLQWLNKSPAGLQAGQIANVVNLSAPLIEHAVIHFLVSEKLHDYLGICCGHGHSHHDHTHAAPSTTAILAYNTYNVLHTLIHVAGFKGLIDHVKQQADVIQSMQEELMRVRQCIENAYAIMQQIEAHPILSKTVHGFTLLQDLFTESAQTVSPELKEFLSLIIGPTFEGQPSFFSRHGVILRAYALAQKVHGELQEKLQAVAALDFYVSTAQLMEEYRHTATPLTFAHFHTLKTPLLIIKGFWNPLVNGMQPIQEVISLGSEQPHVAIVTGPNKAGKSTSLQAICVSIVMAQTLGIVPAAQCEITPFSCIKTGFNMVNRINENQSLFSASLDFANALLDHTKTHKDQFMFVALDELFNSTDFNRGSLIARRFAYALDGCHNCITFMATHFNALTELEKENPSCYKNFKAALLSKQDNSRYILEPGISLSQDVWQLIDNGGLTKAESK